MRGNLAPHGFTFSVQLRLLGLGQFIELDMSLRVELHLFFMRHNPAPLSLPDYPFLPSQVTHIVTVAFIGRSGNPSCYNRLLELASLILANLLQKMVYMFQRIVIKDILQRAVMVSYERIEVAPPCFWIVDCSRSNATLSLAAFSGSKK